MAAACLPVRRPGRKATAFLLLRCPERESSTLLMAGPRPPRRLLPGDAGLGSAHTTPHAAEIPSVSQGDAPESGNDQNGTGDRNGARGLTRVNAHPREGQRALPDAARGGRLAGGGHGDRRLRRGTGQSAPSEIWFCNINFFLLRRQIFYSTSFPL